MNYALTIGEESVATEITIHRNQVGKLLFQDNLKVTESGETVYAGPLEDSKLSDEELNERASQFYSSQETVSETKTGLPKLVLAQINEMLLSYGYQIKTDLDEVYRELNHLNRVHIEEGLVARVAFLVLISSSRSSGAAAISPTTNPQLPTQRNLSKL